MIWVALASSLPSDFFSLSYSDRRNLNLDLSKTKVFER
jgi:hypothetical protein